MEKNEFEVLNTPAIEKAPNSLMSIDSTDLLIKQAAMAEKAMVALKIVMEVSLKITTEQDWVLIGGTPYLQESGATKVAKLFGISWQIISQEITMDVDGYKTFNYRIKFYDNSTSVEAEGSRSCKDDFFAKAKDGIKKPDEIDEGDVKRAAYTNCVNTGIKRMIPGLRGISKETLSKSGLDTNKMKGYDFNSNTPKEISEEGKNQKDEIIRMLNEATNNDEIKFKQMLKKYTSFTKSDGGEFPGYEDINKVSEKAMLTVYGKVKKAYEAWLDKKADAE